MITPDYYDAFRCIGGACKNSCCAGGWDIEVDDAAMSRYLAIEGTFGARVREAISSDNVFLHNNGRCKLLSDDGLCELLLNGEGLCVSCDEYPRYTEYYGDYCERGIALSCEVASRLVLDSEPRIKLVGNSGKCHEELFPLLYASRERIFSILADKSIDIATAIRLVLDLGEKLQAKINNNDYSELLYTPIDRFSVACEIDGVFEFLKTLDFLAPDWGDKLSGYKNVRISDEKKARQLAVYFVYRYFLKAVFDCDALSKLKLMAVSVIAICALSDACGDIYESARRYSVEVEHSEDNVDLIYDEFLFNDDFSIENIINMIK